MKLHVACLHRLCTSWPRRRRRIAPIVHKAIRRQESETDINELIQWQCISRWGMLQRSSGVRLHASRCVTAGCLLQTDAPDMLSKTRRHHRNKHVPSQSSRSWIWAVLIGSWTCAVGGEGNMLLGTTTLFTALSYLQVHVCINGVSAGCLSRSCVNIASQCCRRTTVGTSTPLPCMHICHSGHSDATRTQPERYIDALVSGLRSPASGVSSNLQLVKCPLCRALPIRFLFNSCWSPSFGDNGGNT